MGVLSPGHSCPRITGRARTLGLAGSLGRHWGLRTLGTGVSGRSLWQGSQKPCEACSRGHHTRHLSPGRTELQPEALGPRLVPERRAAQVLDQVRRSQGSAAASPALPSRRSCSWRLWVPEPRHSGLPKGQRQGRAAAILHLRPSPSAVAACISPVLSPYQNQLEFPQDKVEGPAGTC